jgi:hypothetical protein
MGPFVIGRRRVKRVRDLTGNVPLDPALCLPAGRDGKLQISDAECRHT